MKTLILISTLAVSALMVSAAYPKPATIFAPNREDSFSLKELDLLANSAVFQRAAVTYIFRKADANKSGNLDFAELKAAYNLLEPMYDDYHKIDEEFIQNEFNQGNFVKNQVISIDEFAFLFNRLFKFMNNNPVMFSDIGDPDKQWEEGSEIICTIEKNFLYMVRGSYLPKIYQEFNTDGNSGIDLTEYKSGLQKLVETTGLNFVPDDYTIRDSYELMLSPCDTLVNEESFRNYMVPLLNNYLYRVRTFYGTLECQFEREEEEEMEEEVPEEEFEDN